MADSQLVGDGPPAKRQKVASPSLTPGDNAGKMSSKFVRFCIKLY